MIGKERRGEGVTGRTGERKGEERWGEEKKLLPQCKRVRGP